MKNKECTFRKVTVHNHHNNAEESFSEMQSLCKFNKYLMDRAAEKGNARETLSDLINGFNNSPLNKFKIDMSKHKHKIYRMLQKMKIQAHQKQSIKKNRKQNKKPNGIQSNLFLNALGKRILAIDEKYKHLIKNKAQQANPPQFNVDEIESKSTCKICFERESDTVFIPCGHSICKHCLLVVSYYICMNQMKKIKIKIQE